MRKYRKWTKDGIEEGEIDDGNQFAVGYEDHSIKFSSGQKILSKLPRRIRAPVIKFLIKLKIIRRYGLCSITAVDADGTIQKAYGYNLVVDLGVQEIGDIIAGIRTTNIDLDFIEPGEGTTAPVVGNTDIEDELEGSPTPNRLSATKTRNASSPFEVNVEAFLSSSDYTRPQTINEMAVFFGPDTTGDMFARAILNTPIVLSTSTTATLNYVIVFR